jgi:hypothetical protein
MENQSHDVSSSTTTTTTTPSNQMHKCKNTIFSHYSSLEREPEKKSLGQDV